jgi:DNA topoisomerase 2-associated protein PAT1
VKPGAKTAPSTSAGTALLAGLISQSEGTPSNATGQNAAGQPLSHRAACAILERVYDAVLELEQLRRVQPNLVGAEAALKEQKVNMPEGVLDQAIAEASQAVEDW